MSISKKNKDNLKSHAGVALAAPATALKSDDPLRFWTNHPTESSLVNLHPYADGEFENPHPLGSTTGTWTGPFTGRPRLITELAPALEARCALLGSGSVKSYTRTLRAWWRFFDAFEAKSIPGERQLVRVQSLANLNELHEVAAHLYGISPRNFLSFLSIVNDARRLLRLPALPWASPKVGEPVRTLITDEQARELKTALKQDWERVRRTWARNDAIRAEAEIRVDGADPSDLGDEGERLLKNWQHFQIAQHESDTPLPTGEQLRGLWKSHQSLSDHGLEFGVMRAILFPTVEEAEVAYHLALMNSGWNPSTLSNLDATSPFLLSDHPKDDKQLVLSVDGDEEATLYADKPRAGGKTQFCTALKKHSSSAPMIVAAYLKRVDLLRKILKQDYQESMAELVFMQAAGEERSIIEKQFQRVQEVRKGCISVWLYLDRRNKITWLDGMKLPRYERKEKSKPISYMGLMLERLNARRALEGKTAIPPVTPSDFRDIYARWVYVQSGGNILAVMLALGHASLSTTGRYLENNIFSAENDEHARHFMTHLFAELERGRVDLTILAQLVRHGSLTPDMDARLAEYRQLMRSRVGVGCTDPRHPPEHIAPAHVIGRLCGTQRCLNDCPHAKFLPESVQGIAMRVEELHAMSDYLPRETWLQGGFQEELDAGEALLESMYPVVTVAEARNKWREYIAGGEHLVPGLGSIPTFEEVA